MSVDVVVVAYNSRDTLRDCVEPLAGLPGTTVTVVDNACPQRSTETVADLPVTVVHSERNGGFAYGCNLGIASGTAELVLLLNPDAKIDASGVAALVAALNEGSRLAAVGPRTLDEDGQISLTQRRFPQLRRTFAEALFVHRIAPLAPWTSDTVRDLEAYERPGTPDWVSGCCVLLRRSAVEAVGGFDEGYFLYSEETDLFRRLNAAGWRMGYEPRATARHVGYSSACSYSTEPIRAYSRVRYARKHHGRVVAVLEAAGVILAALARAVAWIHEPARARGNLRAARVALRAPRSVGGTL
jgi:GT2 family glycosyltransferase